MALHLNKGKNKKAALARQSDEVRLTKIDCRFMTKKSCWLEIQTSFTGSWSWRYLS